MRFTRTVYESCPLSICVYSDGLDDFILFFKMSAINLIQITQEEFQTTLQIAVGCKLTHGFNLPLSRRIDTLPLLLYL